MRAKPLFFGLCVLLFLFSFFAESRRIQLRSVTIDTGVEPVFDSVEFVKNKQENYRKLSSVFKVKPRDTEGILNDENALIMMTLKDLNEKDEMDLDQFSYLGSNTFLGQLPLTKLSKLPSNVEWIGHFKSSFKTTFNPESSVVLRGGTEKKSFNVLLAANTDIEEHRAAAARLNNLFGEEAEFKVISNSKAIVKCEPETCKKVVSVVVELENVVWIELKHPVSLANHYGRSIMQGGLDFEDTTKVSNPIWEKGLTGEGEVITIMDTSLDWDNCFFADDQHDTPPFETIDETRRKVIGYYRMSDNVRNSDGVNGHGTHVAGTVAGSVLNDAQNYDTLQNYNGMAPSAKIIFQAVENEDGGFETPDDMKGALAKVSQLGSKIHTNSWGSLLNPFISCEFDCQCVWGKQIKLLAEELTPGEPAVDELCEEGFGASCCYAMAVYRTSSSELDDALNDDEDMLVLFAAMNEGTRSSKTSISSEAASKNTLIVGSSNTAHDHFLQVHDYVDLESYATLFGYDSVDKCCSEGVPYCCLEWWKTRFNDDEQRYQPQTVTDFSSRGPTLDGRIRPDVVAPGNVIISAYSDGDPTTNQCGVERPMNGTNDAALVEMSGTSMATPGVAGAASLVREYFRKGFYPSGSASEDDVVTPSGMLLKAMLVLSGKPLDYGVDGGSTMVQLEENPNHIAGHGLVTLSSVLKFENASNFDLYVSDRETVTTGEEHVWTFAAQQNGAVDVTLTWYDPPANPAAAKRVINQLNLVVGDKTDDREDVTKRLMVSVDKGDEVEITVYGVEVAQGPQSYALAFTHPGGDVEGPVKSKDSSSSSSSSSTSESSAVVNHSLSVSLMFSLSFVMMLVSFVL